MSEPIPNPEPEDRIAAKQAAPKSSMKVEAATPEAAPVKEMFSREYVAELRAESESWRRRHQAAGEQLEKLQSDAQASLTEAQQAANARILRAEMKALALKAGLRDLDCLKLLDMSSIQLQADDTLDGAEAALARLKETKPFLFGEPAASSSPPEAPPAPRDTAPADVSQLPPDEYARSKHAYLRAALQKAV